jgi:Ca-activated chloride channel family protein
MEEKEFVYEMTFPEKTGEGHDFVEHLWARRKVGYLLDEIRAHGEKKELVDEVVTLAKRYGITTPYTSFLIVPDGPMPVANTGRGAGRPDVRFHGFGGGGFGGNFGGGGFGGNFGGGGMGPGGLAPRQPGGPQQKVTDFAKDVNSKPEEIAQKRLRLETERLADLPADSKKMDPDDRRVLQVTKDKLETYRRAGEALKGANRDAVQTGKLGVDLSLQTQNLRNQNCLERTAVRQVLGRNCLEVGGVWIDEGFGTKTPVLVVKAQSDAYFRLLERQPKLKEVFRLGNYLVWMTPSGTALIIDTTDGKDKLADAEIDKLFVASK